MREYASGVFTNKRSKGVKSSGGKDLIFTPRARDETAAVDSTTRSPNFKYRHFFGWPCLALRGAKASVFAGTNGLVM